MVHKVPPSSTSGRSVKETKYKKGGGSLADGSMVKLSDGSDVHSPPGSSDEPSSVRAGGFLQNAFRWLSRRLWGHEQSREVHQMPGDMEQTRGGDSMEQTRGGDGMEQTRGGGDIERTGGGGDMIEQTRGDGDMEQTRGGGDIERTRGGGDMIGQTHGDGDMEQTRGGGDMIGQTRGGGDMERTRDVEGSRGVVMEVHRNTIDTQTNNNKQLPDGSWRSNVLRTPECSFDALETVPCETPCSVDSVETIADRSERLVDSSALPAPCAAARSDDDYRSSLRQKMELFTHRRRTFLDKVPTVNVKPTTDDRLVELSRKRRLFASKRHSFLEELSIRVRDGSGNSSTRRSPSSTIDAQPFEIPGHEERTEHDDKWEQEKERAKGIERDILRELELEQQLKETKEQQEEIELEEFRALEQELKQHSCVEKEVGKEIEQEILRELELERQLKETKEQQEEIELEEFRALERELEQHSCVAKEVDKEIEREISRELELERYSQEQELKERQEEFELAEFCRMEKELELQCSRETEREILRAMDLEWQSSQLREHQEEIELEEFCQMERELELQCEAGANAMGEKKSSSPSLHSDTSEWLSDDEELVRHDSIWYLPPPRVLSSSSDDEDTDLPDPVRPPRLVKLPRSSHMDGWFHSDSEDEMEAGASSAWQNPPHSDPLQNDADGPRKLERMEPAGYEELKMPLPNTLQHTQSSSVLAHDGIIDENEATLSLENDLDLDSELPPAHVPLSANPLSVLAYDVDGVPQWEPTVTDTSDGCDADSEQTSDSEDDSENSRPVFRLSSSMYDDSEDELRPLLTQTSDTEDSEEDSERHSENSSCPVVRLSPSMFDNTEEELRPLLVPTPISSEEDLPLLFSPISTSEEDLPLLFTPISTSEEEEELCEEEEVLEPLGSPITTSDEAQASQGTSHGSFDTLGSLSSLESDTVSQSLPPALPLPSEVHAESLGNPRTPSPMLASRPPLPPCSLPPRSRSRSLVNLPTPSLYPLPPGCSSKSRNDADVQGPRNSAQEEHDDFD